MRRATGALHVEDTLLGGSLVLHGFSLDIALRQAAPVPLPGTLALLGPGWPDSVRSPAVADT
jgi:hypothetical protein